MLAYLLDEHLSPEIAEQIARKHPEIRIISVQIWRGGAYRHTDDDQILLAAAEEGLTLVTYDQQTIFSTLLQLAEAGISHAGVVFIDDRSIRTNDYGSLIRALIAHWERYKADAWTDRVDFLRPVARR